MALVFSNLSRSSVGNKCVVIGAVAFDSSYPTGGEPITLAELGLSQLEDFRAATAITGYVPTWNGSTSAPKLMAFYGDNNNAADGPLIEVPDTTNLSTVTGVRFTAIGV